MVQAQDLKSQVPEFKSRSDDQMDLFVVPGLALRLRLNKAKGSGSCQLEFLTCNFSAY